jgi:hypothetical protein
MNDAYFNLRNTQVLFDHGFAQFLYEFLPLENALAFKDIMAVSVNILGGQGILKKQ